MPNLINEFLPADIAAAINNDLQKQIAIIKPYKVNLTDKGKIGVRTMAEGREGMARLVSKIATNNVDSLARENNPEELANRLVYDSNLEDIRQTALSIAEMISETQIANGIDIMKLVDTFVANLQTSRANNGSLDNLMREVDEYNQRFANKTEDPQP